MVETQNFYIIIPTYNRYQLLKRTLDSLMKSVIPDEYLGTIIVENGGKFGIEKLIDQYPDELKLIYRYYERGNKSDALNNTINSIDNKFVILADDDIRFSNDFLVEYVKAFKKYGKNYYFGGSVAIDYEVQPDEYLLNYLPPSARGFNLGNKDCKHNLPNFVGINFAIHTDLFNKIDGFNPDFGPGNKLLSVGDETQLQNDLISQGYSGIYIAESKVWHYVPKERSTKSFCLERVFKTGIYVGYKLAEKNNGFFQFLMIYKDLLINLFIAPVISILRNQKEDERFWIEFNRKKIHGILHGLKNFGK